MPVPHIVFVPMRSIALVALGSALGGVGRHWLCVVAAALSPVGAVPAGVTLVVNVAGSAVIGLLAALGDSLRVGLSNGTREFLMAGVCGGFTTFSLFSLQTLRFLHDGDWMKAFGNAISSVVLCVASAALGYRLGRIVG